MLSWVTVVTSIIVVFPDADDDDAVTSLFATLLLHHSLGLYSYQVAAHIAGERPVG